jgi:glycosyltransferase involved in cell wall biosynthesis
MKISLVSEHASPLALVGGVDAGGQNVHVAALARALADLGADVVVHTRRDDPALPRRVPFGRGVVVEHLDAGPPIPIDKDDLLVHMDEFADRLIQSWSTEPPDVVHAHFWMSGVAAVRATRSVSAPVAITYHALGREKRRHQGRSDRSPVRRCAAEAQLAREVDRVIATTKHEENEVRRLGASNVSVVPCGVDAEQFTVHGPAMDRTEGLRRVVAISRLVPRKGIAEVIRAVAGLADVELLVAGGPPAAMLDDDPYAAELALLAESMGMGDRFRLLGAVERIGVPALLRSADVVCCAPWYEPFGLVALEAMACGVPVVASRVGGLAETVVDGVSGLTVPPRDPEALRAAVATVLTDRGLHRRMSRAASRRAEAYAWPEIAATTLEVYESMILEHGSRASIPGGGHVSRRNSTRAEVLDVSA